MGLRHPLLLSAGYQQVQSITVMQLAIMIDRILCHAQDLCHYDAGVQFVSHEHTFVLLCVGTCVCIYMYVYVCICMCMYVYVHVFS